MNYPVAVLEFVTMLTLPRRHTEAELQLARRVAQQLGSEDLHVFWSDGLPSPQVRPPASPTVAQGLAVVAAVIGVLASALGSRRPRPQPPSS